MRKLFLITILLSLSIGCDKEYDWDERSDCGCTPIAAKSRSGELSGEVAYLRECDLGNSLEYETNESGIRHLSASDVDYWRGFGKSEQGCDENNRFFPGG